MLPPQQGRDDSLRARQAQGRDAVKTRTRCRKTADDFSVRAPNCAGLTC
jgi:hypothetical protein